ncbi:MAG TPA: CvpA family protein [Verrucomicrobiae bacterium]|jgi:uncharacterized membrane protein required for colicin V production|nr:CvpA family protein [Verrucomicrobiae bacterium]
MNFGKLQLNWFDLLVLVMVTVGFLRGRKRGMSEELLDVLMWLCIVVAGALFYLPLGQLLTSGVGMPPFFGNVIAYAFIGITLRFLFAAIKRAVGEKLVQSDTFGRMEYYLGMVAGPLRYFCILIFLLSFLHAKYISDAERAATAKMQADNFGSISFPTFGSLQHAVFYESISGKFIRKNLRAQLMQPADATPRGGETIAKRRQRDVEEIMK